MKRTLFLIGVGLVFGVALAAAIVAGMGERDALPEVEIDAERRVRIAYVDWSSAVASANLMKAVLETRLGVRCDLTQTTASGLYQALADGAQDATLAAWLPSTHGPYLAEVADAVVDLGPNLEGTRTGLLVPAFGTGRQTGEHGERVRPPIPVDAIGELAPHARRFHHRIVGIDPGAGVMRQTREAIAAYDLEGFRLEAGSEQRMVEELERAIRRREWIVVTGWTPHWMQARWSLRYLDDPKGVYGGEEAIHTVVRDGLREAMPDVARVLDRFSWTPAEMDQLMSWNQNPGADPYENALRWVRAHPERVDAWVAESDAAAPGSPEQGSPE